jgi:CheY-like chemotaxis protein/HPt (histidine-containing phosphotransfer) domain-containing protein
LINDVLDLSKIEAEQLTIESIPCSPQQIISETVSVLRVGATEKGIGLDYRWDSAIPKTIHTDPYRLKQLLLNLVGNAIKFTDQGSVLIVARVEREPASPALVIEVRDTGIGIAQDKLALVFQPFVQADDSVTRKYGGTGLGLAIARKIAVALGGSLSATSVVGKGSTFVVRIAPGAFDDTEHAEAAVQYPGADLMNVRAAANNLDGLNILVVDDGDTNRKLIRLLVERFGGKARMAENGQVALDMADAADFDVILMDMQMPVMDGYTAAAKLRERGFAGPIIALTAHALKGDREKCEQAGCSGYLAKPVDADQLCAMLASHVTRPDRTSISGCTTCDGALGQIHSLLPTDDAELREIVLEFIGSLDTKLSEMQTAWDAGDCTTLATLAHWLKGAGGTVGFACFTSPAAELEQLAKSGDLPTAKSALTSLRELQSRLAV